LAGEIFAHRETKPLPLPAAPEDVRERALLLMEFAGGFRRSELPVGRFKRFSKKGDHLSIVL
jgi:hypothetical protein